MCVDSGGVINQICPLFIPYSFTKFYPKFLKSNANSIKYICYSLFLIFMFRDICCSCDCDNDYDDVNDNDINGGRNHTHTQNVFNEIIRYAVARTSHIILNIIFPCFPSL